MKVTEQQIVDLIEQGRYDDALVLTNELVENEPDNDEAYYLRGFVYKHLNKWGESLSDLNKAIELNPDSRAVALKQLLQDIIDFRHTDLYNP